MILWYDGNCQFRSKCAKSKGHEINSNTNSKNIINKPTFLSLFTSLLIFRSRMSNSIVTNDTFSFGPSTKQDQSSRTSPLQTVPQKQAFRCHCKWLNAALTTWTPEIQQSSVITPIVMPYNFKVNYITRPKTALWRRRRRRRLRGDWGAATAQSAAKALRRSPMTSSSVEWNLRFWRVLLKTSTPFAIEPTTAAITLSLLPLAILR